MQTLGGHWAAEGTVIHGCCLEQQPPVLGSGWRLRTGKSRHPRQEEWASFPGHFHCLSVTCSWDTIVMVVSTVRGTLLGVDGDVREVPTGMPVGLS